MYKYNATINHWHTCRSDLLYFCRWICEYYDKIIGMILRITIAFKVLCYEKKNGTSIFGVVLAILPVLKVANFNPQPGKPLLTLLACNSYFRIWGRDFWTSVKFVFWVEGKVRHAITQVKQLFSPELRIKLYIQKLPKVPYPSTTPAESNTFHTAK